VKSSLLLALGLPLQCIRYKPSSLVLPYCILADKLESDKILIDWAVLLISPPLRALLSITKMVARRLLRAVAILATVGACEAYCPSVAPTLTRRSDVRASARMAVQALNNQVLVELQVEPAKSAGGIMLPTNFDNEETEGAFQRKPPATGTVLSVGPGTVTERGVTIPIVGISEGQRVVIKGGFEGVKQDPSDADSVLYLYPRAGMS
jgi:co-chaperonin GroES (HSP10)